MINAWTKHESKGIHPVFDKTGVRQMTGIFQKKYQNKSINQT